MKQENKGLFSTLRRWIGRAFMGRDKGLEDLLQEERLESPSKTVIKRFFSRKLSLAAVVLMTCMFALVLLGPLFNPLDLSYNEISQKNIPPGMNLQNIPNALVKAGVRDMALSSTYSVAVDNNGKVYVWGNKTKMSKTHDLKNIPQEVIDADIIKVAAGTDHIIALGRDGTVYGWGEKNNAQYGNSTESGGFSLYKFWPKEVSNSSFSGDDVSQLVAGQQVTAIVLNDGTLYVWGNTQLGCTNRSAALELSGQVAKVALTQDSIIVLTKDGRVDYCTATTLSRVRVSNSGEIIEENDATPPPIDEENYEDAEDAEVEVTEDPVVEAPASGTRMADINSDIIKGRRVVDIASTSLTAAVLLEDGEIIVSGSASMSEKNVPDELPGQLVSLDGGRYHYIGMTADGTMTAWGDNFFGQSSPPSGSGYTAVYTDFFHAFAITAEGKVESWGLKGYLLGTDGFGRDILNRIINGGRMTMTIGAIAVIISTIIGLLIGCISGYFGGWIDMLLMRVAEIISSLPFLPFALILSAVVRTLMTEDQRIMMIMVVLGVLSWPPLARLSRAQVLAEREKEFVVAAKAIGVRESKIAFKHILPNIISVILVTMTLDFAGCMLTESSLSYLGFGVSPPQPTWGNMLTGANNSVIIQQYWWQWVFPAVALAICTISINLIGDGLRDAIDPKSGER